MKIHLSPSGDVERGSPRGNRPSYRWVPAYSQAIAKGRSSMPLPRREWQAMARRDKQKCVFHLSQKEAEDAATENPS